MDNITNPPQLEGVDINRIKNSIPQGKVPNIIIQSNRDEASEVKIQGLEKLVKGEILLNVLLVLLLLVTIYVSLVLRLDILKFLSRKVAPAVTRTSGVSDNLDFSFRVVAAEPGSLPPVYISRQGINIDTAFGNSSSSARLTVYGKLRNEVIGFLPYWIVPKIDAVDTRAVTSISYFGLEVDGNGNIIKNDILGKPIEAWTYFEKDKNLEKFISKAKLSKLKIYLTLKCFNQDNIVALTTSAKARENFINNAVFLLNSRSLDGLNIDFEYIGTPEKRVKDGFSALMIDLYKTMKNQYPKSVLTIDTFVDAASADRIHDIPVLAQNSDGLVIMGYDFHTPNSSVAGPVAPFEGAGLSVKGLMASYLDKAPAEKLILGVPYYGYDWPVRQNGDVLSVAGVKQQVNVLPYMAIANNTRDSGILWDENAQVPWYSYQDPQTQQKRVVYFENVRSLGIKYDFVKLKKMQGVALWALGFDGNRVELNQTLIDKFAE